ncbi:MAG: hypothetical protein HC886_18475, partial [Leptolyngbyaceae cyanobacterium SM1_1_3]|nr:hypothetical protein [Leptolyngbyaceae cyanobacterium SM1_1_3]
MAQAELVELDEAKASGETSHLTNDDASHQTAPHFPAEDEPVATVEQGPDTTATQISTPPLLSDIEPLTATSEALLPPPETLTPDTRHLTPNTRHPNPPFLAQI